MYTQYTYNIIDSFSDIYCQCTYNIHLPLWSIWVYCIVLLPCIVIDGTVSISKQGSEDHIMLPVYAQ